MPELTAPRRAPLVTIFLTVFIDLLGVGIIVPISAPLLFESGGLLADSVPYAERTKLLGYLLGIFMFFQFFSGPLLGSLSDKFGRRKVLTLSLLATIAGFALFAFGIYWKNIAILFVSRAFLGTASGNLSVVYSAIADLSDPASKAKNFGLVGAAFSLGFIIGPVIGGLLSDPTLVSWFNPATPFLFSAMLAAI
ncbi:MAG: MFS transporter, partial [Sphingobacteriaceae bacterium]|nr:MFS transporter [Cytophagaceae bacterium]